MGESEDNTDRTIDLIVQTGIKWASSLALSPDGKILASGDVNGIKLWDLANKIELGLLCPHRSNKIIFSPDGRFLVSGDSRTIRLWDLTSGQELKNLKLDNKFDFAFSQDGKLLVSEGKDEKVKIWDVFSGQELKILIGHSATVDLVLFSPDGKILASVDQNKTIKLWDTLTGQELGSPPHQTSLIESITLSPDGTILAVTTKEKKEVIRYWETDTGKEIFPRFKVRNEVRISDPEAQLNSFCPDGRTIVIKEANQEAICFWHPFYPATSVLAISPDGKVLVYEGSNSISFWNIVTKQEKKVLLWDYLSEINSINFSPDRKVLALGGGSTALRLWNLEIRSEIKLLPGRSVGVRSLAFSHDGKTLASGNGERLVKLWDLETGQIIRELSCLPWCFDNIAFSHDGKLLAGRMDGKNRMNGDDDYIVIWDVATGELLKEEASQEIEGFPTLFESSDQSVSGKFIARAKDGKIKFLDRTTEQEVATLMVFNDQDWLVTTPENLFDGTPKALENIIWRLDNHIFNYQPVEWGVERFFYPNLLQDLLAGTFPASRIPNKLSFSITENNEKRVNRVKKSEDLAQLKSQIAELDALISLQLNEIIHHPEFQKLEASWRGLHYLVHQTRPNQHLKIKVFPASKKDLLKDFERAIEFDQSNICKRIYDDIYHTFGEDPFGMLIGDYEFSLHPQDFALLEYFSQVAASSHAPFISAVSPELFGWENFAEISEKRDIGVIFDQTYYSKWRSFRELEESRYVGLCLPHILLREPYQPDPGGSFNFKEVEMPETRLWGNAAYAFGACVAKAYRESGWCGLMSGPQSDGLVEGLAGYKIGHYESRELYLSVDVLIEAQKELELSGLGFIPLNQDLIKNETSFFSDQSCHRFRRYDTDAANFNARAAARFPRILAWSRFAHYLKVIVRDRSQPFADQEECRRELNRWLEQYCYLNYDEELDDLRRSRYPLKSARIDLVELPAKPGQFRGVVYLSPVYQIGEVTVGQRIVFEIPQNRGNLIKRKSLSIPLEKISNRLFVGNLSDEFLRENKKFYLAIRSTIPENKLTESIYHSMKISVRETIGKIIHFALPGIPFRQIFPADANPSFYYFLLGTESNQYWKLVEEEKKIAVNAVPELDILEIKLLGDQFDELDLTAETMELADYDHLNLINEPSLLSQDAGINVHSYRFSWIRTGHEPRIFRVNIEPDQTGNIVVKGYQPISRNEVRWIQNDIFQLSAEEVAWWLNIIERCGFWELRQAPEPGSWRILDRIWWRFEGLKNGVYHKVPRRFPRKDHYIVELGLAFLKLGRHNVTQDSFF